jgi:hypothetical protein
MVAAVTVEGQARTELEQLAVVCFLVALVRWATR